MLQLVATLAFDYSFPMTNYCDLVSTENLEKRSKMSRMDKTVARAIDEHVPRATSFISVSFERTDFFELS